MKPAPLKKRLLLVAGGLVAFSMLGARSACAQNLTFNDIEKLPKPQADQRISYGSDPSQFGDLRLPQGKGPHPVVIVIHGGCWFSKYDLNHLASFSDSLTRLGAATWSLEYRRIGNESGGWPGTFEDVAKGTDHVRVLARRYPLDLNRVIAVGHSAGGQLALWLAARAHLKKDSPLYSNNPLKLHGVVSLAGITDLRKFRPNCGDAVTKLLGGAPDEVGLRYEQTSPIERLPLKVPQWLIHGNKDPIVPVELSKDYAAAARTSGDRIQLTILEGAGHFDLISPQSSAWLAVEESVRSLLKIDTSGKRR